MIRQLLRSMPDLTRKLRAARIAETPEHYVKKTMMTAGFLSIALVIIAFGFVKSLYALLPLVMFPVFFFYFLHYADMRILQLGRSVEQEIVYAARFLIIELESGVPLYNTFQNLARNYKNIGIYFQEVVDKVNLGTSTEQAINEILEYVPSDQLRRVFWQILNSLRTGSEISDSLRVAVDHVVREQKIQVVEYGRKLNPMAMFFMMIAIILPSLGMTMIIVMATFIGFRLSMTVLLTGVGALAFVQFMFLATIRSQRPAVAFN